MPLFFFHLRRRGVLVEDPDGSDLPDMDAVCEEVVGSARQLWASAIVAGVDLGEARFEVTDAEGTPVMSYRLRDALPPSLR